MGGHGQTSWFFMRARLRKSVTKGPGENFDDRRSIQKKPIGKEAREVFTRAEPRSDAQSLSHVLLGKSISVSGFQSAKHAHYELLLLQEFPYMRHQLDHFDRLLKEIVTSPLKTFGFQMWKPTHRNNRDTVCFRPLA